jgi:hypothetical protein
VSRALITEFGDANYSVEECDRVSTNVMKK